MGAPEILAFLFSPLGIPFLLYVSLQVLTLAMTRSSGYFLLAVAPVPFSSYVVWGAHRNYLLGDPTWPIPLIFIGIGLAPLLVMLLARFSVAEQKKRQREQKIRGQGKKPLP